MTYWACFPHKLQNHPKYKCYSQQFYELILVDTKSIMITYTPDKFNPGQFLYSECIIKNVLSIRQWKNPFEERNFSIQFDPKTYNYNDYSNAWYRAFLYYPEAHSWFFNFHYNYPTSFLIWFYHWWTWFGASPSILPPKVKTGWEC